MGERFLQRTFETFVADTEGKKRISAGAKKYAMNFQAYLPRRGEHLPGKNGIIISGTIGTGKTHIAAAIANYLLNSGTAVICMTERNLFGEIRKTYSKGQGDGASESEVRRIYVTVPLLIIDDLGKEKPTDWTLATLYAIIDGRYDSAMPVIITTNYDDAELIMRLTPNGADKNTAAAIVDRLNEMCKSIVMEGESWRSKKGGAG
jgi:DNA replication protein DnaC